jgi:hypothetical protein
MRELVSALMNTPTFISMLGFLLIVIPTLGIMIVVKDDNNDGKL